MAEIDPQFVSRKAKPISPTALSMRQLRADGWTAQVVEHRVPRTNVLRDLFQVVDIVALRGPVTMGVQATSRRNISSRVRKIAESDHVSALREAGWRLVVWGWDQPGGKGTTWRLEERDVS